MDAFKEPFKGGLKGDPNVENYTGMMDLRAPS